MEKLTAEVAYEMYSAVKHHRYDWTFEEFRQFRKELGVTRETVIPYRFAIDLLEYRYMEYNPDDYGLDGKFGEVTERVNLLVEKKQDMMWAEFSAHKAGRRDLSYGRKAVEKKTGAGDWLVSTRSHTPDAIVKEYSKKTTLIHWEVVDLEIDITCTWSELLDYLGGYIRKKGGSPMGAAYWFKNQVKRSEDGDRWILEIQSYRTSSKKLDYIRACPYNKK